MHARPPRPRAHSHTHARALPNPCLLRWYPRQRTPPLNPHPSPPTRVWGREEEDIRLATMPFLTAENDVRTAYLMQKVNANEAEVMKAVRAHS